jgi:two-component system, chemotaxis family, chemotaxis protein CheY
MKALVVETSGTMRAVLRRILCMRGFEVSEAGNGQEALQVLNKMGRVDLVLVDWTLRGMNSLEFITRLRHETAHETMVLMLAERDPGIRELHRALIAGADDYLTKPFTSLQIDEKMARAGLTWQWDRSVINKVILADNT